ncbi:MAG: fibronectin type III domain-containing protein [Fimbriimonadaceae bacterium]|nr:fibronectin type III domain-containing protein [Fimbriimonadaceae bacterium]
MPERIKRQPDKLRDQLTQAIAGATALGPAWPASAPTVAAMTTARDNLDASITDTEAKENAWKVAAQLKATRAATGIDLMKKVDEATDLLYGPSGAEKNNFGLPPKGAAIEPLHKLIAIVVTDGAVPGSLKFDWESIEGASYEIQWSNASSFATVVGSATSASASDYIISGLVPGTQYWMRVRPVRGADMAPRSDPATRVAPV